MPPMCTPEKNESPTTINNDDLYFTPQGDEESITDCSDIDSDDDDEIVKERMDKLLNNFPDLDRLFNLHGQVGEGTFSTVYVAALKKTQDKDTRYAIKHVVPTCHPERIKFELKCLKEIGGEDNVAGIELCLRNDNNVIFIMPYQPHDTFSEYVGSMNVRETANYMRNLMIAIARVHKFGIIHRDIKPSNFLYDRRNEKFLLVDFGLAQKQPENKPEPRKVDLVKQMSCSTKRKRDPLSPLNGVIQDPKRSGIYTTISKTSTPIPAAAIEVTAKTPIRASSQKENDPKALKLSETPKETKSIKPSVKYIKFDHSPEAKILKSPDLCKCYGKAKVCSACIGNKVMQASRAGTPGFRPPEVLFKYANQTTAVDMWSAGIIMLSILSDCTNFFSCPNDTAALLELITLFGHENMKKIANKFGRYFMCSEIKPALDLRKICCTLRSRGSQLKDLFHGDKCAKCEQYLRVCLCRNVPLDKDIEDIFPSPAYDLLMRLLDLNPKTRITAEEALKHQFLNEPY